MYNGLICEVAMSMMLLELILVSNLDIFYYRRYVDELIKGFLKEGDVCVMSGWWM